MKWTPERIELSEGLKRARRKYNEARPKDQWITQADLAEKMGKSEKTIMNWEQGQSTPSVHELMKLAKIYGCDMDYLTGRLDQKTHDIHFIHDQTGLSEKAIEKLLKIGFTDRATGNAQALSFLIEDPDFSYLLALMSQTAQGEIPAFSVGNAYIHTEKRAVINSETRAIFSQISDHVREKMETVPSENRWIYNIAYGLHAEGKLTDDQLSEVIDHFDQGDFDFTPEGWSIKSEQ